MLFTEAAFFLFCPLVLLIYWRLPANRLRKFALIIASYVFYGFWDYRFVALLVVSTLVDFFVGRALVQAPPRRAKVLITLSLTYNLGMLGFFKYCNFFVDSFARLARALGMEVDSVTLNIVLPVGVSFFTFQSLSYTLDVYRKRLAPARSLLDFAAFISFFPQLVAGPIVRASDFLGQLIEKRTRANVDVVWALNLFLVGFFKKACVADNLAPLAEAFYRAPTHYLARDAWIGAVAYAAQIYCDFSGYSDMAIAVAGLFGYTLRSNFEAPYLSTNITDFWRRWHTSLSSWLRDYVYIPLGGSRHGVANGHRNLMITMLLGGLWHGASWTFVLWGGMHGLALVVHKEWTRHVRVRLPTALGWAMTQLWVVLAWVPFRATTAPQARGALQAMFGGGDGSASLSADRGLAWSMALLTLLAVHAAWQRLPWFSSVPQRLRWWQWGLGYGACCASVLAMRHIGYVPFVYFQF